MIAPSGSARALALGLALWTAASGAGSAGAGPTGSVERGERLYSTGRLADGRPVAAERPGVGPLTAEGAACSGCHRPSGRGSTEGGQLVPPIAGPVLFAPGRPPADAARLPRQWLRHQQRPAYDEGTLARALAEGLDPAGQPLGPVMPRYRLDAAALADLSAYLRSLGTRPVPGWRDGTLHLATIVTPDAAPARREQVLQAMARWSQGLAFGAMPVRWRPWVLDGPPERWAAQLDARWRADPVFAIVSGAGGARWERIDAWCEARRLPCLMPVVDLAPLRVPAQPGSDVGSRDDAMPRHWTLHLSQGTWGEAALMARWLQSRRAGRVLQWVDGPAGERAAVRLRQRLAGAAADVAADPAAAAGAPRVDIRRIDGVAAPPSEPAADVVVLWLGPSAARRWLETHPPTPGTEVLLSGQLAPPSALAVPVAWRPQVRWATQRADPVRQQAGATLSLVPWAARLGLPLEPGTRDLADVHAATVFFGDAVARMRGVIDPAFLLERLEVAVDRRPAGADFARLSLGPGQRIAAQGGHLLGYPTPESTQPVPLTPFWRVEE